MSDLDAAAIARSIAAAGGASRSITVAPLTASTNDDAKIAASTGAPDGAAFLAEAQSKGAGAAVTPGTRPRGEPSTSARRPPRASLAASIAPITLAVGVAGGRRARGARRRAGDRRGEVAQRRARGAATRSPASSWRGSSAERGVEPDRRPRRQRPRHVVPARARGARHSLALLGVASRDRSALAAELILAIDAAVRRFKRSASRGFLAAIAGRDALLGQAVDVAGVRGVAAGIDAEGRLLVRGEGGEVTAIVSGEVVPVDAACAADASRGKLRPAVKQDTLVVHEIYKSVQGESTFAGLPCAFIRLTGCNLRCSWCDTEQAFYGGKRMRREDVLAAALALGTPLVELTGGEPLLQPGALPLMTELCDAGRTVLVETSGEADVARVDPRVHKIMDLKAPGSGESHRNRWSNLDHLTARDEIKFVLAGRVDYEWMRAVIRERGLPDLGSSLLASCVWGSSRRRISSTGCSRTRCRCASRCSSTRSSGA